MRELTETITCDYCGKQTMKHEYFDKYTRLAYYRERGKPEIVSKDFCGLRCCREYIVTQVGREEDDGLD